MPTTRRRFTRHNRHRSKAIRRSRSRSKAFLRSSSRSKTFLRSRSKIRQKGGRSFRPDTGVMMFTLSASGRELESQFEIPSGSSLQGIRSLVLEKLKQLNIDITHIPPQSFLAELEMIKIFPNGETPPSIIAVTPSTNIPDVTTIMLDTGRTLVFTKTQSINVDLADETNFAFENKQDDTMLVNYTDVTMSYNYDGFASTQVNSIMKIRYMSLMSSIIPRLLQKLVEVNVLPSTTQKFPSGLNITIESRTKTSMYDSLNNKMYSPAHYFTINSNNISFGTTRLYDHNLASHTRVLQHYSCPESGIYPRYPIFDPEEPITFQVCFKFPYDDHSAPFTPLRYSGNFNDIIKKFPNGSTVSYIKKEINKFIKNSPVPFTVDVDSVIIVLKAYYIDSVSSRSWFGQFFAHRPTDTKPILAQEIDFYNSGSAFYYKPEEKDPLKYVGETSDTIEDDCTVIQNSGLFIPESDKNL